MLCLLSEAHGLLIRTEVHKSVLQGKHHGLNSIVLVKIEIWDGFVPG